MKRDRENTTDRDSKKPLKETSHQAPWDFAEPMRQINAIVASVSAAWNAELKKAIAPIDQAPVSREHHTPREDQTEKIRKEILTNRKTIERLTDKLASLENTIKLDNLYHQQPAWARLLMEDRLISFNERFEEHPSIPYIWLGSNELTLYEVWGDYVKIATTIGLRSFCGLFLNSHGKPVNYVNISKNGPNASKFRPRLSRVTRDRLQAALFP